MNKVTSSSPVDPWVDYPIDSLPAPSKRPLSWSILIPLVLLFLAALPDAMFAPILKQLFVDRFAVSESAAHLFMAVNIIGVIGGIMLLKYLRQILTPLTIVLVAALAESVLLLLMALPIGFTATLLVRAIEGGADLLLIAVPLTLVANQMGEERKSQGFGIGAMTIIVSLAFGAFLGGVIASPAVFTWGAGLTLVIAIIAALIRTQPESVRSSSVESKPKHQPVNISRRAWCGAWLLSSDRGLAALLGTTVPIALASAGVEPMISGVALAIALLIIALGSWPAGWIADRTSPLQVRIASTAIYALGFLLLAIGPLTAVFWLIPTMIVIGVGAAGLMPTALSLGSHRQARSSEVALMQGASQFGFTAAVLAASALLAAFAGPTIYQMILLIAIAIYIAINVTAISTLRRLDTTQVTVLPDQEQELKPSTVFIFEPCEASAFVVCPDQTETTSAAGETERGIVSSLNPGAPMPAPRR